jgi:GTPase
MTWRISEGKGFCYYYIGITDDGTPRGISRVYMEKSINNLISIIKYLGYNYEIIYFKKGISGGFCAKVFIVNNNSSASY